ncbi:MAG: D-sedoheptulose 7-phosphate isomerase [Melioribacteraceae bacterium]|nr:D-sedoheptulose 7-phosphate isomerase [Melioribacteraceae bacterium]
MIQAIFNELNEHNEVLELIRDEMLPQISKISKILVETINSGNKILLFGNGGSAADAQHIAAELSGRYKKERKGLPAIALTTDTSALTAISNDYGFDYVFSRQVEALASRGDAIIGISTSGNSENVLQGIILGKKLKCKTIGLSGYDGGKLEAICDHNIIIPSNNTARIQEMHILIGHIFCQIIENSI